VSTLFDTPSEALSDALSRTVLGTSTSALPVLSCIRRSFPRMAFCRTDDLVTPNASAAAS
jgi:hypothetical protein